MTQFEPSQLLVVTGLLALVGVALLVTGIVNGTTPLLAVGLGALVVALAAYYAGGEDGTEPL